MQIKKSKDDIYYAHFTGERGPQRISLRTRNLQEAKALAKEAGIEKIELLAKAKGLTNEAITRALSGKRISNRTAFEKYIAHTHSIRRSASWIRAIQIILEKFLETNGLWDKPPAAITTAKIDRWINRKDTDAGLKHRRDYLYCINGYCNYCISQGWMLANPGIGAKVDHKLLTVEQKEPKQRIPFTEKEYQRLLEAAMQRPVGLVANLKGERLQCRKTGDLWLVTEVRDGVKMHREGGTEMVTVPFNRVKDEFWKPNWFWRAAIVLSYHLGLRMGDVARLEWECFRYEQEGQIIIWPEKKSHGKRLLLPLPEEVAAEMRQVRMVHPIYCFPEQREIFEDREAPQRRAALSVEFTRICRGIGIDNKSFHCLRHSFARNRRKLGATVDEIRQAMGHEFAETTKGYLGEK